MDADAAGLAHGEQIDNGNNKEKREGHLKDGSKQKGKHQMKEGSSGERQRVRVTKSGRTSTTV
jgi:hypothetical protein